MLPPAACVHLVFTCRQCPQLLVQVWRGGGTAGGQASVRSARWGQCIHPCACFRRDPAVVPLQVRGLAARLGGQRVFCALAAALEGEADLRFAATLVQALNLLLLTAPEVRTNLVNPAICCC